MDWAAGNDHLEILKWLHTNRSDRARLGRWTGRLVLI